MLNTELLFWLPLFFFAVIEEFSAGRPQQLTFQRWISNFSLLFINRYLLPLIISILIYGIWKNSLTPSYLFQDSLVLTILIALLVYDLVLYWQHRLFHRIQFFWRFHRIHHSDLELDISTSVRQHPVSSLFSNMITGSLLVLSGISYEAFILCILCSQLYSFFTHANIKLNTHLESVMGLIFITPKTHTVHHLANLPYTDSNYGEIFSVWDRLFNSYRQYPGMDAHNYLLGLDSIREKQDQSVIKLLLNPFKH